MEIQDSLRQMQPYRRRPSESHNRSMVVLPEYMNATERDETVARNGIEGVTGLANSAMQSGHI